MEQNHDKIETDSLIPPVKSSVIEALLKLNNVEHPIAKKYLENYARYKENLEKKENTVREKVEVNLPELGPIDVESFYKLFKDAFNFFNGKSFDETVNGGEGRKLARTLIAYFLKKRSFYHSPVLNNISTPNLEKGLLIIGGFGCGKTSVINTFHRIFKDAISNPVFVKDTSGTDQLLKRYDLYFPFLTTNKVVEDYEKISEKEAMEAFWNRHNSGIKYYDDLMTERTASNYGKVELFKDILEKRYSSNAVTLASMNYYGISVEETLDAISEKYGERVYDRIFEMFNIITLNGKSLRK